MRNSWTDNYCVNQMIIEQSIIANAATWCHILSDFCPWCHVGCAAATASFAIPLLTTNALCTSNCAASYEEEGANPHHCPVH